MGEDSHHNSQLISGQHRLLPANTARPGGTFVLATEPMLYHEKNVERGLKECESSCQLSRRIESPKTVNWPEKGLAFTVFFFFILMTYSCYYH